MSFLNGTDPSLRQTRTPTVNTYAAGSGFTAGSTTQLSLTSDPGTENNVIISFDGIVQHRTQYSVSGTTVTFTAAIPAACSEVEATYTSTIPAFEPADNSVTNAKMADDAVGLAELSATGTPSSSNYLRGDNSWGAVSAGEFLLYHHTAASNTAGDTYANGAWRTVTLDTEVYDTGNHGSLSTNVITLAAGTYRVTGYHAIASASSTAYMAVRFRNTSDSSTVATSGVIAIEQDRPVIPICRNRFTIAGSKNFELQVFPGSNNGYESAGGPVDNTEANIFGVVYLEKE